ncbi:hypothetical protein PN836_008975 [Ningiella sp. W23]|uniref:hypothetical protein n=1 Tax=Ningiella sp. W23 TaxID=3023715 RepID=UPI00375826B0
MMSEQQKPVSSASPIYVLCNANRTVGYGHFFRCLHLARELKRLSPGLIVSWFGNIDETLLSRLPQVHKFVNCHNVDDATQTLLNQKSAWVLTDSYHITDAHLDTLSTIHQLICIDDFANLAFGQADALINFTVSASDYAYQAKHQFLGPQYFINDPSLIKVRQEKLLRAYHCKRVLIAMGGFDRFAIGHKIALALYQHLPEVDVVLLSRDPNKLDETLRQYLNKDVNADQQSIQSRLADNPRFLHVGHTDNMAELYASCDLVISGGGLIKYESAYCAIPNISVAQTPEQLRESETFSRLNLCISFNLAQQWHNNWHIEDTEDQINDWNQAAFIRKLASMTLLDDKAKRYIDTLKRASAEQFATHATCNLAKALLGHINR